MSDYYDKDKNNSENNNNLKISLDEMDNNNINDIDKYSKKLIKSFKKGNTPNDKSNNIEATTTERKPIDIIKESDNNEINDTSVDIKTDFGEENIDIKKAYKFKNHISALNSINKSAMSISTSKEIKIAQESQNKEITPSEDKKNENNIIIENDKSNVSFGKIKSKKSNVVTPGIENIKKSDNLSNYFHNDTLKNDEYFSFDNFSNYKSIYFKEIMLFKTIEFEKQYETLKNTEIFHTSIIYKKKECILLLKNEYLYILEQKSIKEKKDSKIKNNENNPDISLIRQLKKDEMTKDESILKKQYEISHPLVCLNFNLLSCKLLLNKKNTNKNNKKFQIQILILGTSKKISFFFQDYDIYKKYSYLIGSTINTSEGYKMNKIGLSFRTKSFYKDTYITTSIFESLAKTGDLVLFRTLDCLSDCQRFFTRDQYDHIALIIKINRTIELLETTSNENCNLLEWNSFKYRLFNLVFKKVVLRRLNIEEENLQKRKEIQENIEKKSMEFITKVNKKKYIMSILKMIIDKEPKDYEISGEWDKAKGFCCSALTAAYYIYNGVMKLEKSVHCVRPGDFEQDRNRIVILPGFSFGPEKIIEFST